MTGLPPAEEATHYSLLNGRRPRASSTSSGCDTSGRFGDVALCARIPQSGHFEAPSSPSGCFKRTLWGTLWGRSVMRPTAGHLALRPRSARARRTGRRTSPRAKAGQIRPRPRSVRPNPPTGPHTGASSFLSETWTDKATSPKRPRSVRGPPLLKRDSISAQTRRAGPTPPNAKGPPPGDAGDGLGKGGRRLGGPPLQGKGPAPGSPPRTGTGPGREGRPAPRNRRGDGRPAPRAARASRRPSWSPAARPAAPEGAARSRRSARRCRIRR